MEELKQGKPDVTKAKCEYLMKIGIPIPILPKSVVCAVLDLPIGRIGRGLGAADFRGR
jgi:hypothetical protein